MGRRNCLSTRLAYQGCRTSDGRHNCCNRNQIASRHCCPPCLVTELFSDRSIILAVCRCVFRNSIRIAREAMLPNIIGLPLREYIAGNLGRCAVTWSHHAAMSAIWSLTVKADLPPEQPSDANDPSLPFPSVRRSWAHGPHAGAGKMSSGTNSSLSTARTSE
jgi:hypothetical protein